jgi:hypothetical protein
MEIKTIELRELRPSEGMCLTNGDVAKPPNEPIYLGVNDSQDNWHEITEEEYSEILDEQEETEEEMWNGLNG